MGFTPKLRFEGYSGDWDRHTLGDVFTQTSNYVNPKEDGIALWSLTVEDGLTPKTERYVREFLVKKDDKFKEVRPGDIVYNPMNMTLGAVGYNGMDRSVAVSGYYTTIVAKENYDAYFINTWLKSPQAISLYKEYATGTLLEKQRVQFPTLSIIPAVFPLKDEQADIGILFGYIDNLIALYQHKSEMLARAKQFYLQNLFPKKGEKVPAIRFAGFEGEWERKLLSEITYASGKRNRDNLDLEPYAITNESGFIPQNEAHDEFGYMKDTDRSAYIIVTPNSFGYNPARINVGSLGYYAGTQDVIVSSLYEVFQTTKEIDDRFLLHWFNTPVFRKWIGQLQEGSVRLYFYYDKLCECHALIPSLGEQEKIADFLSNFDHLLALQSRKLETLKKMKQFMLQNLFV